MESWSLSNPKRDVSVCECSGNNIKLSQCQRDISRHVQVYGLSINHDEISDEMDLILCPVQVNKCNIPRANFSFSCHE